MRRRRQWIAAAVTIVFAAVVAAGVIAWRTFGPSPSSDPAFRRPPVVDASRYSTRWPIKHVVFIVKENRSFDSMFGLFPGADGATTGRLGNTVVPLTRGTDGRLPQDLSHNYTRALSDWNGGKMDGFAYDANSRHWAYTVLQRGQIPQYWHWAQQFALGDRFFTSVNGPSFPNHLFSIAAQSGSTHDNPKRNLHDPRAMAAGLPKTWGCDAPLWVRVKVELAPGQVSQVSPCFDFTTVGDLLSRKGVPWAFYAARPTEKGYIWSAYAAVRHVRDNEKSWHRHVFPVDTLLPDIRDGRLPPVTWITPRFALSEHPEYNLCYGENWTAQVVDSIMQSPMWKDTAIFLTWDDWGGFYDHVAPPQVDRFGLGMRVPMLILSAYSKQGYIDHNVGEFSSVLRFIEHNWGVRQVTRRDRATTDLSEAFDFSQQPRAPDPQPQRTDCHGSIWATPSPHP